MNQCVPSWDLEETQIPLRIDNSNSSLSNPPSLEYEVAELTWENGQPSMHGLVPPRVVNRHLVTSTWEKPISSGGTLESIVNQATFHIYPKSARGEHELVPWFNNNRAILNPAISSGGAAMTMDALVPCTNIQEHSTQVLESARTHRAGCSTGVGSYNPVRVGVSGCKTNVSLSVSESATCGGRTLDTCELGTAGFTSENTSSGKEYTKTSGDDHDSVCHRRQRKGGDEEGKRKGIIGKSSVSTKRSRAAAIHNQSERKRRDKINQRMKTLQKMVPNSSKTDKASMLDEVIEYLKQLQAQVHMMSRMSMHPSMMLPLAMQQQMQMSLMGMQMAGMGAMGMGMGAMDINSINRAATMMPVMPPAATFMPAVPSWEQNPGDRLQSTSSAVIPDPLNTFLANQSQAMPMDYARLAAMYQQFQQNPGSGPKN